MIQIIESITVKSNTNHRGQQLIELPQYNKGTAFTRQERIDNGLIGLIPYGEESLGRQVVRAYGAYLSKKSDLERHIYLRQLQDLNETLFYRLVMDYATEMIPIIYTPTVGDACMNFSEIYRKPRGLFISYPERAYLEKILANVAQKSVGIIVITDSEAILGIGDQGVGGMGIPIGKLSLYSALGGINPNVGLPVLLDVGTNNETLLRDPLYVGWQHERIRGQQYDDFIDLVLTSIHKKWPETVIQFEDFGPLNATRLLNKYKDKFCCFNDDIQGTAAVTVGSLIAAGNKVNRSLSDSKIVIVGAGSAGCGIARGCVNAMVANGTDRNEATRKIFLVDRSGLVHKESDGLRQYQLQFAKDTQELGDWKGGFELFDVVHNVQPEILIGVSGQSGLFTQELVEEMGRHTQYPCIFALSNPTVRSEATPLDLMRWTDGRALVATGSPFPDVYYGGRQYEIAQCNNAYAFPGIGLGLMAARATRVTEEMFTATARVIGESAGKRNRSGSSLLPPLGSIRDLSLEIAVAVANIAFEQEISGRTLTKPIEKVVEDEIWFPDYSQMNLQA